MLTTLAAEAALDHPLLVERPEPKRAGVLVVSSDRGIAAHTAPIFSDRSEELFSLLREAGKQRCCMWWAGPVRRRTYSFRNWNITGVVDGFLRATHVREHTGP